MARPRVLLVDDDPDICEFLGILLATEGMEGAVAASPEAALASAGDAAAVLLDLAMPGLDGLELCRRLRGGGYAGAILIVSARPAADLPRRAAEAGADGFVRKPFENAELIATLRRELAARGG